MILDNNIDPDDIYVPDEEEQREINEILNSEENRTQKIEENPKENVKNRLYFYFNDEDHWANWLKMNGIKW